MSARRTVGQAGSIPINGGPWRVRLLGRPTLEGPGGPLPLDAPKSEALLWYLAAQGGQSIRRHQIAALLWDGYPDAAGRRSLTSALARLRAALPVWPIRVTGDRLTWDPAAGVGVDAREFLERIDTPGRATDSAGLEAAIALWRGPFLDGFDHDFGEAWDSWLALERHTWSRRATVVLRRLVDDATASERWDDVGRGAARALEIDDLQEWAYRALMLADYHRGDRAAALVHFTRCAERLRVELEVEPHPATLALRDAIARGSPIAPATGGSPRSTLRSHDPAPDQADMPRRTNVTPPPGGAVRALAGAASAAALPLIGRDALRDRLRGELESAAVDGRPGVLLFGEAGIGKTRLLEELLGPSAGIPYRGIVVARCREAATGMPYAAVAEALAAALQRARIQVARLDPAWRRALAHLLPEFALDEDGPSLHASGGSGQLRLNRAILHAISLLPEPRLVVVEDLHWADQETFELVDYLVREGGPRGIVVLASARRGDLTRRSLLALRALARDGALSWHDVEPLSAPATRLLIEAAGGGNDERLIARVEQLAGGNPLYAVEMVRAAREERDDGSTPVTIRAVVEGRLRRLPADARSMLEALSVHPGAIPFDHVRAIADLDTPRALDAMAHLGPADLVVELADGGLEPSHDMIRRAVLDLLGVSRRAALHARAYHALSGADESASPDRIEALALHARAAGLWQEAVDAALGSARHAEMLQANRAAAAHLQAALDSLRRLPSTPERRRSGLEVRLRLVALGPWFDPTGQQGHLTEALAEAVALQADDLLPRAWLADMAARLVQGDLPVVGPLLERLVPLIREMDDPRLLATVLQYQGMLDLLLGELERSRGTLEDALALALSSGEPAVVPVTLGMLAINRAAVGEVGAADGFLSRLAAAIASTSDPVLASHVHYVRATVANLRGQWRRGADEAERGLAAARGSGHSLNEFLCLATLGRSLLRLGDAMRAMDVLELALGTARRAGTEVQVDWVLAALAETQLELGDLTLAESTARRAARIARERGFRRGLAYATIVRARIAAAAGRATDAEELAQAALVETRAMGTRPDTASAHAVLAEVASSPTARVRHRDIAATLFADMAMAWHLDNLRRRTRGQDASSLPTLAVNQPATA